MQGRNRDTDVENKRMHTKGESVGGRVMNWAIGIDMYTLMCIKWMTNKNLLYKKINKIKFKKKKPQNLRSWVASLESGVELRNMRY